MTEAISEDDEGSILSFNPLGRVIAKDKIEDEYAAIRANYERDVRSKAVVRADAAIAKISQDLSAADRAAEVAAIRSACEADIADRLLTGIGTPSTFARVGKKSGTHLLKLVSSKVSTEHAIFREVGRKDLDFLPSVNAGDIPYAKIVFRPIEVAGHPAKSLVAHIMQPDDLSPAIRAGFASVFGGEALNALEEALKAPLQITELADSEFPIIYLPYHGRDIQVSPLAPAGSYMAIKRAKDSFFLNKDPGSPKGRWSRNAVSANPQNISGAIGGPKLRFLAEMPAVLADDDADILRYINGGSFPKMRSPGIQDWVLSYAKQLEADVKFNNSDTRAALQRTADGLIKVAIAFMHEIFAAVRLEIGDEDKVFELPSVVSIVMRRGWRPGQFDVARAAVNSPHFRARERELLSQEKF